MFGFTNGGRIWEKGDVFKSTAEDSCGTVYRIIDIYNDGREFPFVIETINPNGNIGYAGEIDTWKDDGDMVYMYPEGSKEEKVKQYVVGDMFKSLEDNHTYGTTFKVLDVLGIDKYKVEIVSTGLQGWKYVGHICGWDELGQSSFQGNVDNLTYKTNGTDGSSCLGGSSGSSAVVDSDMDFHYSYSNVSTGIQMPRLSGEALERAKSLLGVQAGMDWGYAPNLNGMIYDDCSDYVIKRQRRTTILEDLANKE